MKARTIGLVTVVATLIAVPLITGKYALAAPTTNAASTMMKLTVPGSQVVIPLVKGLYDGKDIFLITTEHLTKVLKI